MFSARTGIFLKRVVYHAKHLHLSKVKCNEAENPISKTFRILGKDIKNATGFEKSTTPIDDFPAHVDVVVIGGGAMGSSIAYWLKERTRRGLSVAVVERDPTYSKASTVLSVGGLRQQFSVPENIQMSLFGAEFLRNIKKHCGEDNDVYFSPYGYLLLASEQGAEQLQKNSKLQRELGARNELLTKDKLKAKFPWLNVEDVALGCYGLEKEGWFDPWSLLNAFKKRAIHFGAEYVNAEATGFEFREQPDMHVAGVQGTYNGLDSLIVKLPNGETRTIKFAIAVIAAGPDSGRVAHMAKIGNGDGILMVPLPVEPRKRFVYCFECQENGPGLNTPLTIDYTGTYFRRDGLGGRYIAGRAPKEDEEPSIEDLNVDHSFFDNSVWPNLAHRVPAFNGIKVKSAWGGYYEFNTFDENGIVGPHPYYNNLYIATGFSGHGIQQSPAVGRAMAEMILDGGFTTIDLTRLGFDRILLDKPIREQNCF
ncbi:lethal (2) 37Bb [Carabus blaptoides fortunei]